MFSKFLSYAHFFVTEVANKLCNDVNISILCILDLILWSIEKDVHNLFTVYFVVFEAICNTHLYCAIFFCDFSKKIIANKKYPYLDNSKTQMFSLLFWMVLTIASVVFEKWEDQWWFWLLYFNAAVRMVYNFYDNTVTSKMTKPVEEEVGDALKFTIQVIQWFGSHSIWHTCHYG